MNFGYLIIASKNESYDYVKMAYLLAISIKLTQKEGYDRVALVTDDYDVDIFKSPWVFDKVIKTTLKAGWDARIDMQDLSPWDDTVCLDADMLFLRDISHNIRHFLDNTDLYIANQAYTYRGELVTSDFYRKTFTKNNLPNLYSYFTFFKKNKFICNEFFSLCKEINTYKEEFKNLFLPAHKPKELGTDEIFSLSSSILDIDSKIAYPLCFPKIVHLKPMVQNWQEHSELVTDLVGFYLNIEGKLKIGNYYQSDIIHYQEKHLANDETISIMENALWKK